MVSILGSMVNQDSENSDELNLQKKNESQDGFLSKLSSVFGIGST